MAGLSESSGQSYHLSLLKELSVVTDSDLTRLASCTNDIQRFHLVYSLPFVQKSRMTSVQRNFRPKSLIEARNARLKGNQTFQKRNFRDALKLYSTAIVLAPHGEEGESEYALSLANRSAALMSLENFAPALEDIEEAIKCGYPEDLQYKLIVRQAECLLHTNKPLAAMEACHKALEQISLLESSQRKKVGMSVNRLLAQAQANIPDTSDHIQVDENLNTKYQQCPQLNGGEASMLSNVSSKVAVEQSREAGRFIVANSPLEVGEIIVMEKPYASVIRPEKCDIYCHFCYKQVEIPVPCPKCSRIVFCSRSCRQAAMLHYHSTECSINDFLASTGFGVTCSLALRMITIHPIDFFLQLKPYLDDAQTKDARLTDDSIKYIATYNLMTHSDIRPVESIFDAAMQAVILLKCLRLNGYFGAQLTDNGRQNLSLSYRNALIKSCRYDTGSPLSENEQWIGSLLLRHIFILQVNGHEICEMNINTLPSTESVSVGAGIYPTVALFNHSCDPAVTRYFIGDTAVVRTIRPIAKGETVDDNYGPFFTKSSGEKRRKILKERYWFHCMCTPCVENWPLYSQMSELTLQFRCPGENESALNSHHLNDAKSMMTQAQDLAGKGQLETAIELYSQALLAFTKILCLPNKYYLECQEGIRKYFWMSGNVRHTAVRGTT